MSKRTDVHSPANLVTEDYQFFGCIDHDPSGESMGGAARHRMQLVNAFLDMGYRFASVHPSAQCDHCGARLRYAAYMLHPKTMKVLEIGETCLENRFELATAEFHKLRKSAELDRQAQRIRAEVAAFVEENPDLAWMATAPRGLKSDPVFEVPEASADNFFVADVARKLVCYGSLSERQVEAVRKAIIRDQEAADRRAAQAEEPTAPVVEGKVQITGEVLSTKWQESMYGETLKMLVKDDRLFKVWGTVPAALVGEVERGDRVTFSATVTKSDDDETFGFFKRPTKATKL